MSLHVLLDPPAYTLRCEWCREATCTASSEVNALAEAYRRGWHTVNRVRDQCSRCHAIAIEQHIYHYIEVAMASFQKGD